MTVIRRVAVDLSPWTLAVAGLDARTLRLPHGYWITGLASTGSGPWTLKLHRAHNGGPLAQHVISEPVDVRPHLDALVDMAWVHDHESRVVVTADADGWIERIEHA